MEPIVIELPLFDLKYDKIVKPIKHLLTLNDSHFIFHRETYFDQHRRPDDDETIIPEVKETQYMKDIYLILKKHVIGLSYYFDNEVDLWVFEIFYSDRSITTKFKKQVDIFPIFKKVQEWLIAD